MTFILNFLKLHYYKLINDILIIYFNEFKTHKFKGYLLNKNLIFVYIKFYIYFFFKLFYLIIFTYDFFNLKKLITILLIIPFNVCLGFYLYFYFFDLLLNFSFTQLNNILINYLFNFKKFDLLNLAELIIFDSCISEEHLPDYFQFNIPNVYSKEFVLDDLHRERTYQKFDYQNPIHYSLIYKGCYTQKEYDILDKTKNIQLLKTYYNQNKENLTEFETFDDFVNNFYEYPYNLEFKIKFVLKNFISHIIKLNDLEFDLIYLKCKNFLFSFKLYLYICIIYILRELIFTSKYSYYTPSNYKINFNGQMRVIGNYFVNLNLNQYKKYNYKGFDIKQFYITS